MSLPEPIEDGKRDNSLSYGRTPSSPANLTPEDIQGWINTVEPTFGHYFKEKYDRLKDDWEALVKEYHWNKAVYEAQINFKPKIGTSYFLYQKPNGKHFLSLLSHKETNWEGYIGEFKLTPEHSWIKKD